MQLLQLLGRHMRLWTCITCIPSHLHVPSLNNSHPLP